MVRVSACYPNTEGGTFDLAYYRDQHIPMVLGLLGDAVREGAVDQGVSSYDHGSPAPYAAVGHLVFESVEAFRAAWDPHAEAIFGDIPNFTNTTPTVQISEIVI